MRTTKGGDVLIRSAHYLPEDSHVHYLLVGEVRDERVYELARDERIRDRIHLLGYRKDAPAIISACDVTVMPSRDREGLTKGVIEAMAQGIPAIVTNVGGLPELVADHDCGLVVPSEDPVAIAEAIRYFSEDPERCQSYGERAKQRIQTHFHYGQTVRETIALYEDVVREVP
jgi:glycosyltransferase involved in cell wall biosynthesis